MNVSVKHYNSSYTLYDSDGNGTAFSTPVPHKWLHGDTVHPESGAIEKRGQHKGLVGIVDFINRTGMGFTARNIPLYLWYPLDVRYPPMIVSSKDKYTINQIVTVALEHWDDKRPRAGIMERIGDVGNIEVEKRALLLRTKPWVKPPSNTTPYSVPNYESYERTLWDRVCHIDPLGCEDVDDIIAWRKLGSGYEFAIGIADVAAWVPYGDELDTYASVIGQTIYSNGVVSNPMLPTSLSSHSASLRADGTTRPVLALCYTIENGAIVSQRWTRLILAIQTAFTYESVYSDTAVCDTLKGTVRLISGKRTEDSHEWIAELMIAYNSEAGRILRKSGLGILRAHSGTTNTEWADIAEKTGLHEVAWLGSAAGRFVRADEADTTHNGLGLTAYATASSPLRRYADLVNQRALVAILFSATATATPTNTIVLPSFIRHLNDRARIAKAYERDLWFLTNLRTDCVHEVEGVIVRTKADFVWVYVRQWKRIVKIRGIGEIGDTVIVRAHTNLRSTSFDQRIVCSIRSE